MARLVFALSPILPVSFGVSLQCLLQKQTINLFHQTLSCTPMFGPYCAYSMPLFTSPRTNRTLTKMADRILLNACKGKPKSLSLCNKGLHNVPPIIGTIMSLKAVDLKNNSLTDLPKEFAALKQVLVQGVVLIFWLSGMPMVIYLRCFDSLPLCDCIF